MSDRIMLSGPSDVVAAVPVLLGFHPHRSLVALWTQTSDHALVCTLRVDLDTPPGEVSRRLFDLAAHTSPGRLVLVAYPDTLAGWIDSTHEQHLLELAQELRAADVEVSDALVVTEGRYWSLLCTDPDCCPIGGRPVPEVTTRLEAELVVSGSPAVAADRADVAARYRLRPDLTPSPQALEAAASGLPDRLTDACSRALDALQSLSRRPPVEGVAERRAEVCWLLQDVTVRDYVIATLAVEDPDRPAIEALVQVALAAPEDLRPRLAGAAAAVSYAAGDSSSVAVWALVDHAEGDSLARLVASALEMGAPPTVLRDCFREARDLIEARLRDADIAV